MPGVRLSVAAVIAAVLFCGCTGRPSPSVSIGAPTYDCTPLTGGSTYTCYDYEHQRNTDQHQLYAEAEAVYRKFNAEDERIYRAGGASKATPVIAETLTGELLKSEVANYRDVARTHTRMISGTFTIASIKPALDQVGTFEAAVRVCLDMSEVRMQKAGHQPYRLKLDGEETMFFERVGGTLVMAKATSKWIKSC